MFNKGQLAGLMKQAQAMQDNLKKAQDELAFVEVEGEAGNGLVKVLMTCKHDVKRITIDPSLLGEDKDMLEDLVAAAFNDGVRRAEQVSTEKMGKLTAGMPGLPGGMPGGLPPGLREQLARGRAVTAFDYQRACARISLINEGFEEIFNRCDAIVTPAVAGTAPKGLESTGDPAFCTLWTLCGMPALNLPLMRGENGLPLGVQLVGKRGNDARLLRTARWLVSRAGSAG